MSAHNDHGHGAHAGGDHVPHVLPLKTYFATWGTLMFLTVITVAASYVDFGAANLFIAMGIATVKAAVVALIFMHLFWDKKFHLVIFVSTIIFLAIFISFTMFDTEARGLADEVEATHPAKQAEPFAGTREDEQLAEKMREASAASTGEGAKAAHGEHGAAAPAAPAPAPAPAH